jgi:hypothetical protein
MNWLVPLALGLGLTLLILWVLSASNVGANPDILYVSATDPTCAGHSPCYTTIQAAVDAAADGHEIRVAAGTYTGINHYGDLAQVVYISKSVTIRGGYPNAFTEPPDPEAHITTLNAQGLGRVMYITGDVTTTIEGLRITAGNAAELGGVSKGRGDAGGGVFIISATATIRKNLLIANTADEGGGLYLVFSNATLSDNTVNTNTAYHDGAGAKLELSVATLTDNTVSFNTSRGWGGGLMLAESNAMLADNTVSLNTADGPGGGLCLSRSSAMLSDNIISLNKGGGGGGVYLGLSSNVTFTNNTVFSNVSSHEGGGVFLHWSDATLSNNIISSNTAYAYNGGGVYLLWSNATLTNNVVISNTAYHHGGGLFLAWSNSALNGNTVIANMAAGQGGGLCLLWWSDAMLSNNVVADNQARSTGGGLHIEGSSPQLRHTTIARNRGGDGSGIYTTSRQPHGPCSIVGLTNTILVSHSVGITVTAGNTVTLQATLWGTNTWANATDWGGKGTITTNTLNYRGNPAFVDPDAGDYHIGPDSAAIDAGVDVGLTTDIDGQPRPIGAGFDIGADEYSPVVIVHPIYIPLILQGQSP